MTERIINFVSGFIRDQYLLSAVLSILPVTEIKGSVLFAAASGFDPILSFLAAYGASLLLAAVLSISFPFFVGMAERSEKVRRILDFLSERLMKRVEKLRKESSSAENLRENKLAFGVFAFVALPLPLTGVWAGALLAAILRLPSFRTFFALAAGNFVAGGIVLAISLLAGAHAEFVLTLFLLLACVLLACALLRSVLSRRKQRT